MSFEWGWNLETVVLCIIVFLVILGALQIGSHLFTDVASKDELRNIIRQELRAFFKEKERREEK